MSVGRWFLGLIVLGLALTVLPVALLRVLPPPTTAFMLQSPVKPVQYRWVPHDKISEQARRAVVAAEDQKFWTHQGFDLEAIEKARAHNEKSRRKRGASTISQQTAKNLFLWSGGGYFRKGIEAGYTILIEAMWPKERILEIYLNVAEFGPGIYGVEAAAQAYFHKPASALSASEAARLAAVLPSPRRWKVTAPGPYVQARGSWILRQMGHRGGPSYSEPEPEMPEDVQRQLEADDAGQSHFYLEAPQAESPGGALEPIEADPSGTGPQQASEPIPIPPPEPVEPTPEPHAEPAPVPAEPADNPAAPPPGDSP